MSKHKRRTHDDSFKAQAVALVDQGTQSVNAIADELKISSSMLRRWMQDRGVVPPRFRDGGPVTSAPRVPENQTELIPHQLVQALSPAAIARFHAGKPRAAVVKAQPSRDPAELMVLLDLKPQDLEPLQRIKMLANRTGMSTKDLVNALLDLAVVEGIRHKGASE